MFFPCRMGIPLAAAIATDIYSRSCTASPFHSVRDTLLTRKATTAAAPDATSNQMLGICKKMQYPGAPKPGSRGPLNWEPCARASDNLQGSGW